MTRKTKGLWLWVSGPGKLKLRTALVLLLTFSMILGMSGLAQANGKGHYKQAAKYMEKLIKQAEKAMKKSKKLGFSDLDATFWALEAITRMRGFGVITGYDGNVFKPNTPVKQAEALAMIIRAFGLEEEAQELGNRFSGTYFSLDEDIKKNDNRKLQNYWQYGRSDDHFGYFILGNSRYPYVPVSARWSLGYVLTAVEKEWVDLTEINPEKPASRAWVAKVMVRALGYGGEAEARMYEPLPFRDASAIPAGYRGYVAQAVDIGLFEGYTDRTFQPNKPVTRAEMATILDRFISDSLPEEMPYQVVGTVEAVSGSRIKIRTDSGKTLTYEISKDALVVIGKPVGKVSDIRAGDTVRIFTNGSGVALIISVVKSGKPAPEPTREILGTITVKSTANKGEVRLRIRTEEGYETVILDSDCIITDGARDLTVSALEIGDRIIASERDGKVYEILILTDKAVTDVSGMLTSVTIGKAITLQIETKAGRKYEVTLADDAVITYDGKSIGKDDLAVGDTVTVRIQNKHAVRIWVTARFAKTRHISGKVTEIHFTSDGVILRVEDGNKVAHKFTLASDARITYEGKEIKASQIYGGDMVKAKLVNNIGVEVEVTQRFEKFTELTGVISAIETESSVMAITVKQDDCKLVVLKVPSTAEISFGSREIAPGLLRVGDKVKVIHGGKQAVKIEVLARDQALPFGDLYGKLDKIIYGKDSANLTVEYEGKEAGVKIDDSLTKITYGSRTLSRYELRRGDVLRILLDGDVAVEIRIVSRQ